MAVVAPDYSGLGIGSLRNGEAIHHPWVAGPAQANDLANDIIAARTGFPMYLKPYGPFVALGHSQGGGTAWSLAERQVHQPIKQYKGAVAIAPTTRIFDTLNRALKNFSVPAPRLFLALSLG